MIIFTLEQTLQKSKLSRAHCPRAAVDEWQCASGESASRRGRIINSYRALPREFFCLCSSLFVCTGGEKLFCR